MDNGVVTAAILVSFTYSERATMLKLIAAATLTAMCRDLGPLSSVYRWVLVSSDQPISSIKVTSH
jgi:hypothetical protein